MCGLKKISVLDCCRNSLNGISVPKGISVLEGISVLDFLVCYSLTYLLR